MNSLEYEKLNSDLSINLDLSDDNNQIDKKLMERFDPKYYYRL